MKRIVIVSGLSGAGKSSVLKILEDLGFEVIDNLPLSVLPQVISGTAQDSSVALGVDARTRDFDCENYAFCARKSKKTKTLPKKSFFWTATMKNCCAVLPKPDGRTRWPKTKSLATASFWNVN